MKNAGSLKFRIVADIVLLFVFLLGYVFVVQPIARTSGIWGLLLAMVITFLLAGGLWYDFLLTLLRLKNLHSDKPHAGS